jgi:acid phosphatase type 7
MFNRFRTPTNGNSLYWYYFDYGNVRVVQISSEHDYSEGSEQHRWLEGALKSADRSLTPFVVSRAHRAF